MRIEQLHQLFNELVHTTNSVAESQRKGAERIAAMEQNQELLSRIGPARLATERQRLAQEQQDFFAKARSQVETASALAAQNVNEFAATCQRGFTQYFLPNYLEALRDLRAKQSEYLHHSRCPKLSNYEASLPPEQREELRTLNEEAAAQWAAVSHYQLEPCRAQLGEQLETLKAHLAQQASLDALISHLKQILVTVENINALASPSEELTFTSKWEEEIRKVEIKLANRLVYEESLARKEIKQAWQSQTGQAEQLLNKTIAIAAMPTEETGQRQGIKDLEEQARDFLHKTAPADLEQAIAAAAQRTLREAEEAGRLAIEVAQGTQQSNFNNVYTSIVLLPVNQLLNRLTQEKQARMHQGELKLLQSQESSNRTQLALAETSARLRLAADWDQQSQALCAALEMQTRIAMVLGEERLQRQAIALQEMQAQANIAAAAQVFPPKAVQRPTPLKERSLPPGIFVTRKPRGRSTSSSATSSASSSLLTTPSTTLASSWSSASLPGDAGAGHARPPSRCRLTSRRNTSESLASLESTLRGPIQEGLARRWAAPATPAVSLSPFARVTPVSREAWYEITETLTDGSVSAPATPTGTTPTPLEKQQQSARRQRNASL